MNDTGYCMKCKETVRVRDSKIITMSNGRKRLSAICSNTGCECAISKIIS